jgi:hypothetical protein
MCGPHHRYKVQNDYVVSGTWMYMVTAGLSGAHCGHHENTRPLDQGYHHRLWRRKSGYDFLVSDCGRAMSVYEGGYDGYVL